MPINITLRSVKGSPLTASEVDSNFSSLKDNLTTALAQSGVTTVNGRSGAITLTQSDVVAALGFTPSSGGSGGSGGTATPRIQTGAVNPGTGTNGDMFYNTTDGVLYVYSNGGWVSTTYVITPTAGSGITIVQSLPASGETGAVVYNRGDDKLYEWNGTSWVAAVPTIAATQITDNMITTPKLAANSVTADKITANAIVAGKIAAGAIGATEIAAGAITSSRLAANAVAAGNIAAGAINASHIAAGAVTVDKLSSSSAALNVSGVEYYLGGSNLILGHPACLLLKQTAGTIALVVESINGTGSDICPAFFLTGRQTSTSAMQAYSGVQQSGSSIEYYNQVLLAYQQGSTRCAIQAVTSTGGVAGNFAIHNASVMSSLGGTSPTRLVQICNGTYGVQLFGSTVGTFTGAHDGLYSDQSGPYEIGDIAVDVDIVGPVTVNDSLSKVALSSAPCMKTVIGVISSDRSKTHVPSVLAVHKSVVDSQGNTQIVTEVDPQYANLTLTHSYVALNAVGEGSINVCGENGNITAGDLIVTSSMPGKGMKQDDDIVRSITVAKARQSVIFSSPTEVKTIPCIYMCG